MQPALTGGYRYVPGGYDDPDTYRGWPRCSTSWTRDRGTAGNRVFYLSTPPAAFGPIVDRPRQGRPVLRATWRAGDREAVRDGTRRPPASSTRPCTRAFDEPQVFRIDHYLGKETVQNLLALRFANSVFEPIWNRTWVDNVQITVAETLGVGTRGGFYESAGAMRDILQNHVLQVLALALMEPPTSFAAEAVRNEKVKLLRAIRLPTAAEIDRIAVRGQYTRGGTREELMAGYREEPGVDPLSQTETYAALRLDMDNWRWAGVPFYLRTGKRLPRRVTEVALQFPGRRTCRSPPATRPSWSRTRWCCGSSRTRGSSCGSAPRCPGTRSGSAPPSMDFSYGSLRGGVARGVRAAAAGRADRRPDAVHPLRRGAAVLADHRPGDPALVHRPKRIPTYEAGTWGPDEADRLLERDGRAWRNA